MVEERGSNQTLLVPISSIPTPTSIQSVISPTGSGSTNRGVSTHLPLSRLHLNENNNDNKRQITYSPIQSETSSCLTDCDLHPLHQSLAASHQGNELGLPQSLTSQWLTNQRQFFRNHALTFINSRGKAETEIY